MTDPLPALRRRLAMLLPALALAAPRAAGAAPALAPSSPGPRMAEAMARLGDGLLAPALAGPAIGNALLSPLSLHGALGLLALGTGPEGAELRRLLGTPGEAGDMARALRGVRAAVRRASREGSAVSAGLAAWTGRQRRFREDWQALAEEAGAGRGRRVDFAGGGGEAAINAWAAAATRGLIPTIVDGLSAGTEFVLTSAIHFAGRWAEAFGPAGTQPAAFHRADGARPEVPMMRSERSVAHGSLGAGEAIRLDYAGGRLSLWIGAAAVPERTGAFLAEARSRGAAAWLRAVPLAERRMEVRLPRFAFDRGEDLWPALSAGPFGRALRGEAGFRGVTDRPARVSAVLHRARIALDEAGTVAAAATAVVSTRSMQPALPAFSADRPFVFLIGTRDAGLPLFTGYVGDASDGRG